jgi:lambda repressor-like predicted transcriptional regulator
MPAARNTIRATIGKPNAKKPATQYNHSEGFGTLVCFVDGKEVDTVDIRTYWNPRGNGMQPVRASVWLSPADRSAEWLSGTGSAGGCGYHKTSAAIAEALDNAGIELWGESYTRPLEKVDYKKRVHPGGTGSHWYENAARAIAKAMGHKGRMVWVSRGL